MPEQNSKWKEPPPEPDDGLILEARQGSADAIGALYDAYARRIYRYFYSRVGSADEADDLTAQTFLKVIEALPRYQHRRQFTAWIFQIARNHAMDYFRRNHTAPPDRAGLEPLAYDETMEQVITGQALEALRMHLQALSEGERELLRLRFVANLTYVQMAALLGRKEDAVRKAVQRIIEQLYLQMEVKNA